MFPLERASCFPHRLAPLVPRHLAGAQGRLPPSRRRPIPGCRPVLQGKLQRSRAPWELPQTQAREYDVCFEQAWEKSRAQVYARSQAREHQNRKVGYEAVDGTPTVLDHRQSAPPVKTTVTRLRSRCSTLPCGGPSC